MVKLENALHKLESDQEVTLNMVAAFVNQVNAFEYEQILTPAEAAALRAAAEALRMTITAS